MRILITNDDGIDAYGLSLLADLARPFANDITIIAPADNRSGTGRSLSLKKDIHLAEIGEGRYMSLIHISEPTITEKISRMPSSA